MAGPPAQPPWMWLWGGEGVSGLFTQRPQRNRNIPVIPAQAGNVSDRRSIFLRPGRARLFHAKAKRFRKMVVWGERVRLSATLLKIFALFA